MTTGTEASFTPQDLDELFEMTDATETLDVIDLPYGGRFGPLFTSTMVRRGPTGTSGFLVGYWTRTGTDTEATSERWDAWPRCYSLQLAWAVESDLAAGDVVDKLLWARGYHPDHPVVKAEKRAARHIARNRGVTNRSMADLQKLNERAERNRSLAVAAAAGLPPGMAPRCPHRTERYEL